MLSEDLENLGGMIHELSAAHKGLKPQHAEIIETLIKVHAERARMMERSVVMASARAQIGGNVVPIGGRQ